MADKDLQSELTPRQLRQRQQAAIDQAKNDALEISLKAIAEDLERRQKDGSLQKEIASMKAGAVLGQLTRIAAAIKAAAVVVAVPQGRPNHNEGELRAASAVHLTEEERLRRRREAEAVDAEVVEDTDG